MTRRLLAAVAFVVTLAACYAAHEPTEDAGAPIEDASEPDSGKPVCPESAKEARVYGLDFPDDCRHPHWCEARGCAGCLVWDTEQPARFTDKWCAP